MDERMFNRVQKLCAGSGIAFSALYLLSFIILPHNFPPPDPTYTAQELVTNYYAKYRDSIILWQSLAAVFGILYLPWATQLTIQMYRREKIPILSLLQFAGGILTTWALITVPVMFAWCAEVAGTMNPDIIKTVHFLGWYFFDMTYMFTFIEFFVIFVFAMIDKQKPALIPKWVAYLCLFEAISLVPLTLVIYYKTGIFAINGFWNFHVGVAALGSAVTFSSYYTLQDLKRIKVKPTQSIGQVNSRKYKV